MVIIPDHGILILTSLLLLFLGRVSTGTFALIFIFVS